MSEKDIEIAPFLNTYAIAILHKTQGSVAKRKEYRYLTPKLHSSILSFNLLATEPTSFHPEAPLAGSRRIYRQPCQNFGSFRLDCFLVDNLLVGFNLAWHLYLTKP